MLTLVLRTDKPEAEIGLYNDEEKLAYKNWQAHRALAETIHIKVQELLAKSGYKLQELGAIIVFKGPGSFTGLRIGLSVANTLADSLAIPIIATAGDAWIETGLEALKSGKNDKLALPEYGGPARTTKPKK